MGQRREIARGADGPLLRHARMDAQPQEVQQPFDDQRPAATLATRQRIGAKNEHRPHRRPIVRRSNPDGVADQKVVLKLARFLGWNAGPGEVAKAGRNAVYRGVVGNQFLDHVAARLHPAAGVIGKARRRAVPGNGFDFLERQVEPGQRDRVGLKCGLHGFTPMLRHGRHGCGLRRWPVAGVDPHRDPASAARSGSPSPA